MTTLQVSAIRSPCRISPYRREIVALRDPCGAPTEAEEQLWEELRDRRLDRIKCRRQVPIGNYIADFVCLDAKLVIEIDGSQHGQSEYDRVRDAELKSRGFRVLRFWNDDVLRDLDAVCDTIIAYVRDRALQPWR